MDQDLEAIRRARMQELQSQSPDGDNNNNQQKEEQKYVNHQHSLLSRSPSNKRSLIQKPRSRSPRIHSLANPRTRRRR